MKNLRKLVLVIAITFAGTAWSNTTDPEEKTKSTTVSTTVSELLQNPDFLINEDIKAMVSFTVNKKNQIVVLSVDTKNDSVELYIKNRLNYKKLSQLTLNKSRIYELPVRLTSK